MSRALVAGSVGGRPDSIVVRGLRLLEMLATEPMTASDVARWMSANRSTAVRLLHELHEAGYLRRDLQTKRYTIRPDRFYAFVGSHPEHLDLLETVTPMLERLQSLSGEAAVFGLPANGAMMYMAYVPSSQALAVSERIGTVRPMYCSALGKAYLAGLDPATLDVELGRLSYEGGTGRAAIGPLDLRSRVEDARRQGFARDIEETLEGGSCVAAPVFIHQALVGAAGISGPSSRLTPAVLDGLAEHLQAEVSSLPGGHSLR